MGRTRNAEYLQICQAINDLKIIVDEFSQPNLMTYHPSTTVVPRLVKALEYLEERKIAVEPTSGKNRRSPR